QIAAEVLEIAFGSPSKEAIEHRVVAVVTWTDGKMFGTGIPGNELHDLGLDFGKTRQIASHVVEQDCEAVDADFVQRRKLGLQFVSRGSVEGAINFERAQAHSEAHLFRPAVSRKLLQVVKRFGGVRFAPALAQEWIGLGGIKVEA